jgi:hypothetical protein
MGLNDPDTARMDQEEIGRIGREVVASLGGRSSFLNGFGTALFGTESTALSAALNRSIASGFFDHFHVRLHAFHGMNP